MVFLKKGQAVPSSEASLVLPDLNQPAHTFKLCRTTPGSKGYKTFSDICQEKDPEETGGNGKQDSEPRLRSTPELCPPSLLAYSITPEPSTQMCRDRPEWIVWKISLL